MLARVSLALIRRRITGLITIACLVAGGILAHSADQPESTATIAGHSGKVWENAFKERKSWWSFQAVKNPPVPAVTNTSWSDSPIDRFLLARLESAGLQPAPPANPHTWLRRVHFALTGLPPSTEEVRAFLEDPSPRARAGVVDGLLASPHFGERWARHWMDLVRFAESYGHEQDYTVPQAWQYRDYLIRAFNQDVPYPQFVREHIAGDLLPSPRRNPTAGFNESVIATGFWFMYQATHAPVDAVQDEADHIDNQVDVFSKTFLGLTVGCARCHDHKFDPISTKDYYSLTAFLRSSRQQLAFLDPNGQLEPQAEALRRLHTRDTETLRSALSRARAEGGPRLAPYLLAAGEAIRLTAGPGLTNASLSLVYTNAAASNQLNQTVGRIAGERKLSQPLLEKWVNTLVSPAAQKPPHPLQPFVAAIARAGLTSAAPATATSAIYELFAASDVSQWLPSGQAFAGPQGLGENWRVDGNEIDFLPAHAAHSGRASGALQGVLRSPSFILTHENLHLHLAGSGGQMRLIISRYGLREYVGLLFERTFQDVNTEGRFQWYSITGDLKRHLGHSAYLEMVDPGNGFIAVDQVVLSKSSEPPATVPLLPGTVNTAGSLADAAKAAESEVQLGLDRWLRGDPDVPSVALLAWLSQRGLLDWGAAAPSLAEIAARCSRASEGLPAPMRVLAMADGNPEETRVLLRGDPKTPGTTVSRRFLEAVAGPDPARIERGSGRLELADSLLAESDPFAYRVMVNRVWAHLFGRGLAPTVDNFGSMGQPPTHPELLDYLATDFRRSGGSLKQLLRTLCLTRSFQMSSSPDNPDAELRDPSNALLHRMRLQRLEGEAIRDTLLSVSGQLDRKQFGLSVPVYMDAAMKERVGARGSGPLDGERRRAIYQETRRNFLPPLMVTFDLPLPDTTVGQRNSSNVPGQALALMNDPFVKLQAEAWARECAGQLGVPRRDRLERMFLRALSRPARPAELDGILKFIAAQAEIYGLGGDAADGSPTLWTDVCHLFFMMKEFIHVP